VREETWLKGERGKNLGGGGPGSMPPVSGAIKRGCGQQNEVWGGKAVGGNGEGDVVGKSRKGWMKRDGRNEGC